jgi:hypothetical protein
MVASAAAVAQTHGSPRRQKRFLALWEKAGAVARPDLSLQICNFKFFIARAMPLMANLQ